MSDLAAALVLIFCTPFGWCGILMVGTAIAWIKNDKSPKRDCENCSYKYWYDEKLWLKPGDKEYVKESNRKRKRTDN